MADLVNILHDYLAQRHFDLMPADVKSRFDKIIETSAFTGHMKTWYEKYVGNPLVMLDTAITGPTAADDWKAIYYACQKTFQDMDANKTNPVGYGSPYNNPTKDFIKKWFGNEYGKVFTISTPTTEASRVFNDLRTWLTANRNIVQTLLVRDFKDYIFTADYTYDRLLADLAAKRYEKDPEWRKKIESLLQHIYHYQQFPDPDHIPDLTAAGGTVLNFGTLNVSEPDTWYEIKDEAQHIDWFKAEYVNIFDKLLTNATIRSKFLEKAPPLIRDALSSAIADTDYENKDSDDFVAPKPIDSKNWLEKLKKWKDDTYENHLRRFTNPSRGTRIFFSPHSQNIMKGFDKAGIKPTDGLEGILTKKDDEKIQNAIAVDPNTKKHFDWFTKKLAELKKETPDDFKGALRDGTHLQKLVINIIIKASKENKLNEAMTALEVLSVAKYGLASSRTFDKIYESTKDLKIFSDEALSWNKANKGVEMVSKALDNLIKTTVRTGAFVAMVGRNFVSHSRTKIDKFIGKYKNLNNYYKEWHEEDEKRHNDLIDSNNVHGVGMLLGALDNPARVPSATTRYKTAIQINSDNIGDDNTPGTIKYELKNAGATLVNINGTTVQVDYLQNDVDLFDDLTSRQEQDTKWREKNPDIVHDLVAYWNMLETTTKTHTFKLGSMKVIRDNLLENFHLKNKTSQAQQDAWNYINNSGALSYT